MRPEANEQHLESEDEWNRRESDEGRDLSVLTAGTGSSDKQIVHSGLVPFPLEPP